MGRYFITGSSDGLGLLTAQRLVKAGHEVVLHARNAKRAEDAKSACPAAVAVLEADLSNLEETKRLAADAAKLGPYDGIMHNAGVCDGQEFVMGPSGWPVLFTVNTMAIYVLVALMPRPQPGQRVLIVSSLRHFKGQPRLDDLPNSNYDDSKAQTILLTKYLARKWPKGVSVNALSPGWVPTKMGGSEAPDKMEDALDTFELAMLGTGVAANGLTGAYLEKSAVIPTAEVTDDVEIQESLVAALAKLSNVQLQL